MREDSGYNVFLCYKGDEGGLLAGKIFSDLNEYTHKLIKIFYAPACIEFGQDFVDICERIAGEVSLMVLFITKDFFENIDAKENVVGKEISSALKNENCKFLPILLPGAKVNADILTRYYSRDDIYRITHINPIRYTDVYTFKSSLLFAPILESLALDDEYIKNHSAVKSRTSITENMKETFFSDENKDEKLRLEKQQRLLFNYDIEVYDKLLKGRENVNVIDLGSGNGTALMKRLGNRPEINKIIGVEFDEVNVNHANEKYQNEASFYKLDVESPDFVERLREIMKENNIEHFDFINILALISHLKNPAKVIRNVKKVCSKGATILIRNIDDGFSMVYPDEDSYFEKALGILPKLTSCGYRFSGRQVYGMLCDSGYKDISLERIGITSVGMDVEERESLFDTMFKFILNGVKKDVENTEDAELCALHNWYINIYDDLEERFMKKDLFCSLGFMIYTAKV